MRKPARIRLRLQHHYQVLRYRAVLRRQIERNQFFMLMSMSVLLLLASCTKHLTTTRDREHQAPAVAQKGAVQI